MVELNQESYYTNGHIDYTKYMELHIISGYNGEIIYGEDGVTIVKSTGLQTEEKIVEIDWHLYDFIIKINGKLRYAFARHISKRDQEIDSLVLDHVQNGVLEYYSWLIDYMSHTGLKQLKELKDIGIQYQEQIDVAMQKVKREN